MENRVTKYIVERKDWRQWLKVHFEKESEVWLIYPKKASGKPRILYNDAVEEALCFGWIDSTVKGLDDLHTMQRFTPRLAKSSFSQPNIERLKWLWEHQMIHPAIEEQVLPIIQQVFEFPSDILDAIKAEDKAWDFYMQCTESYQRIRVAYIDSARKRPEEFAKRRSNFVAKCREGKLVKGFGGIEKYY